MSSNSSGINVNSLFTQAAQDGTISPASLSILSGINTQIQSALGVTADNIDASEVFLLGILVDDSSSIASARKKDGTLLNNEQNVRDGTNLAVDALRDSKSENDILLLVETLNQGVLFPYQPIAQAPKLTNANYRGYGNTPLYDKSIGMLGAVIAKEQEFAAQGVPVRTATLIVSDGADVGSLRRAHEVAVIVQDMLRRENHIVAAMGIDDEETDFVAVFSSMGISPQWILTPKNDPSSIRKAFQVFSNSAKQASQGGASFSQANNIGLVTTTPLQGKGS